MLPKAGAQNTEIVKNQEAQNTTVPCPGHMSAPYSQSIHAKHIPKGFVVANLAVVRAHYCHF